MIQKLGYFFMLMHEYKYSLNFISINLQNLSYFIIYIIIYNNNMLFLGRHALVLKILLSKNKIWNRNHNNGYMHNIFSSFNISL